MKWHVKFTTKAAKQAKNTNERVMLALQTLVNDLQTKGPFPGSQWPNYSKLHARKNEDKRHCHLIKGNPTYVCCWEVNKLEREIEVYYVGTHEKAPY